MGSTLAVNTVPLPNLYPSPRVGSGQENVQRAGWSKLPWAKCLSYELNFVIRNCEDSE